MFNVFAFLNEFSFRLRLQLNSILFKSYFYHVLNCVSEPVALQVQPSPTTGKFSLVPNGDSRSLTLISEAPDRSKDNPFEDINTSSFAFKPITEPASSFFFGASSKVIILQEFYVFEFHFHNKLFSI